MLRSVLCGLCCVALATPALAGLSGQYVEARTCQVYTGPCFANGEAALTGKEAVMAWNITEGDFEGVDLAGLNVVVVVRGSETLGFQGLEDARQIKSVVLLDERATAKQREALLAFAKHQSGKAGQTVVRVDDAPISMSLDTAELKADLSAGREVKLTTRKARPGDCICSNESAYYPPLAKVDSFAPGVTVEGEFQGAGLGARWSIPDTRSAYMGLFSVE